MLVVLFFFIIILGPIPLGGFWTGLVWSGKRLRDYAVLGLGSVVLGMAALWILRNFTGIPFGTEEGPFQLVMRAFIEEVLSIDLSIQVERSLLISLIGPVLMFVSGALFADLWIKWKTPSRHKEPGIAKLLAGKIAGAGNEPSTRLIKIVQVVGPSLIGLFGTVLTILYK